MKYLFQDKNVQMKKKKINNYAKMRRTNSKIRRYLTDNGYSHLYFFPHSRFSKDYIIDDIGFDGICTKDNKIAFFQCKSNAKPSKKLILEYRNLEKKYGIRCLYLSYFDRKGISEYS